MAALGQRTKKVTTYGKKKTTVINIHSDDTTLSPTRNELPPLHRTSPPTPSTVKRPPLASKLTQETINIDTISEEGQEFVIGKGKGTAKGQIAKHATRPKKIVTKATKTAFIASTPVKPTSMSAKDDVRRPRPRERLESVIIPSRSGMKNSSTSRSLTDSFAEISITDDPSPAPSPIHPVDVSIPEPEPEPELELSHQEAFSSLLAICSSNTVANFSKFSTSPTLLGFLGPAPKGTAAMRKIGEASYSEVFGMSLKGGKEIVVKIIPLFQERAPSEERMPETSFASDVLREVEITKRLSGMPQGGFVEFLGCFIVEGVYPAKLADEWWRFKTTEGSSNVTPDKFAADQKYALIILADGGKDLESFNFDSVTGWVQAAGVFWQITNSLANAEKWARFEHRDMHEGQILVAPHIPTNHAALPVNYLSPEYTSARATMIDFGFSRLDMPGSQRPMWSPLSAEVYEGQGDQWDVYRAMKVQLDKNGDWAGFHPITNVLWLQYILRHLLHKTKSLKKPRSAPGPAVRPRRTAKPVEVEVDPRIIIAYQTLCATEEMLVQDVGEEMKMLSAVDLIRWGREKGWIV